MNRQSQQVSCRAAACLVAAVLVFGLLALPARAQEASPADLKKIMETLEALKKANADLAQQNQQSNQRNEEISRRMQQMEQQNRQVNQRNDELSRRMQQMEKQIKSSSAPAVADAPKIEELNARVRNLEAQGPGGSDNKTVAGLTEDMKYLSEMVDVVGKKALADKVQIGAELRTRVDWFDYRSHDSFPTPGGVSLLGFKVPSQDNKHVHESINAYGTVRMRLNLAADLTDNLKFHSRLTMYKSWNDSHTIGATQYLDAAASREPSSTDLKVERAYADYYFKIWDKLPMCLSFGRLPSDDSLGSDLRENTLRKSTYPSLAYDTEGDGVGLSIGLSDLIKLPNAALRFVYSRMNPENSSSSPGYDVFVYRKIQLNRSAYTAYVAQFETGFPGEAMNDILFVSHFVYFPHMPPFDISAQAQWRLNPISFPTETGSYWKQTFFVESRRFLGSRFDWFAGAAYLHSDPNGEYAQWGAFFNMVRINEGLLSNKGESSHSARGFYAGLRYTTPFDWLKEPIVGVEYNYGSRYWIGLNTGSEDPLHKLDRLGSVWDFYYIQPIDKNLFLRLGSTFINTNYSSYTNIAGQPARHNEKINNNYLLLDAKF